MFHVGGCLDGLLHAYGYENWYSQEGGYRFGFINAVTVSWWMSRTYQFFDIFISRCRSISQKDFTNYHFYYFVRSTNTRSLQKIMKGFYHLWDRVRLYTCFFMISIFIPKKSRTISAIDWNKKMKAPTLLRLGLWKKEQMTLWKWPEKDESLGSFHWCLYAYM